MIKYTVTTSSRRFKVEIIGHAAKQSTENGFNIPCGLVSLLAQTTAYGCHDNGWYEEIAYGKGNMSWECERNIVTQALIRAFEKGMAEIKEQFPQSFI